MTYRELANFLSTLSDEQLDMDVTLYDLQEDEYFKATNAFIDNERDVLDENHPVIKFV